MQGLHAVPSELDLKPLAASQPATVLKLNQGNALDLLKRCAQSSSGTPTITFQKDSADQQFCAGLITAHSGFDEPFGIPQSGQANAEVHFRIASESLPNLCVRRDSNGWTGVGYVTSKLHPKEWSKNAPGTFSSEEEMRILTRSQEVEQVKKNRYATKTTVEAPVRAIPAPSVAKPMASRSFSAVAMMDSDSDSSESGDSSDEEDDVPVISARLGKRMSTVTHHAAHMASKRPRTTDVPVPSRERNGEEMISDEDSEEVPLIASEALRGANTVAETVEIETKMIPDISRDIHSFEDFERSYQQYKDVWPLYIKLHGELLKNKADFETLQKTLQKRENDNEETDALKLEIQELHEQRQPVVDPMQRTYTKLHTAMVVLRQQLQSYSSKHLPQASS